MIRHSTLERRGPRRTYRTPFYRRLHRLLHRDLELRHQAADSPTAAAQLQALAAEWRQLEQLAAECRSVEPTRINKTYPEPAAPDLSRTWG